MLPRAFRLLLATGAFVALGFAAASAADPKGGEVIYPRNPQAADAPADERSGRANSMLVGVALLAAAAGGWLLWRQRRSPAAGAAARHLSIAESKPLGNRQYLVVADYAGRKFLLGVCPGRIELLTPLGDDQPFDEER